MPSAGIVAAGGPPPIAGAPELRLEGWQRPSFRAVEASGAAEILLGPVPQGRVWRVERIAVKSTSSLTSTLIVYVGAAQDSNFQDESATGNSDVAEYPRPLVVFSGEQLRIRWTGLSAGAVCHATVQYQVWRV